MYKINEEKVMYSPVEEEGVIYTLENNRYDHANPTMNSILMYIQEEKSEDDIVAALMATYEVDEATCRQEVEKSIASLLDSGIIIKI